MARNVGMMKRGKDKEKETPVDALETAKDSERGPSGPNLTMKTKPVMLMALLCLAPYFYLLGTSELKDGMKKPILINLAMSVGCLLLTIRLIPVASPLLLKKNMFGFDLNKRGSTAGTVKVPESLGLVAGIVFLTVAASFQPFFFNADHPWLPEHNAAILCICFMLLLGFLDDVLDLPWRVKLLLPSVACFPLLMAYSGHTTILVPKPLQEVLGTKLLELGFLYYIYMGMVAVFCTNSINILAGVNGLEVGQTVVIASALSPVNIAGVDIQCDENLPQIA